MIFDERDIALDSICKRIKKDCKLYKFEIGEDDMEIYLYANSDPAYNIATGALQISPTQSLYDLGLPARVYGTLTIQYNSAVCLSPQIICDRQMDLKITHVIDRFRPLKIVCPRIDITDMNPENYGWAQHTEIDAPYAYIDSVRGIGGRIGGLKLHSTKFLVLTLGDIYSSNFIDRQGVDWNDELLVAEIRKRYRQGMPISDSSRIVWFRDGFESAPCEKYSLSKLHKHYIEMYKWCKENLSPIHVSGWVGYSISYKNDF